MALRQGLSYQFLLSHPTESTLHLHHPSLSITTSPHPESRYPLTMMTSFFENETMSSFFESETADPTGAPLYQVARPRAIQGVINPTRSMNEFWEIIDSADVISHLATPSQVHLK